MRKPTKPIQAKNPERFFMDLSEAARILGLSAYTLREWALAGKIATYKFGSSVKISNLELDRIIAGAERPRVAKV